MVDATAARQETDAACGGAARVVSNASGPFVCTGCCSQMISGMISEVAHMYPAC